MAQIPSRRTAPVAASLLAVGSAALAAVAAGGTSVLGAWRDGNPDRTLLLLVLAGSVVVGALVWVGAAAWWRSRWSEGHRARPPLAAGLSRFLGPASAASALLFLGIVATVEIPPRGPWGGLEMVGPPRQGRPLVINDDRDAPVRPDEVQSPGAVDERRPVRIPVAVLAGLALLVAAGAGLALLRRGRSGDGPALPVDGDAPPDAETARATLQTSAEAMLSDPDPRTAIIGAYAHLLRGLARSGVPRQPYEGPEEYLRRALALLRVSPGPLRELSELFAVARFSDHVLVEAHRTRALGALRAARQDLAPAREGGR